MSKKPYYSIHITGARADILADIMEVYMCAPKQEQLDRAREKIREARQQ